MLAYKPIDPVFRSLLVPLLFTYAIEKAVLIEACQYMPSKHLLFSLHNISD